MKISVIVAVYNSERYIRSCLDSVLAQTYEDWECLCIDDGSTDDSGHILDEYAERDHRFVVLHKENGGVGAARNAALKIATGDFITFLDNDDLLNENWFSEAARIINEHDPDLLRMDYLNSLNLPSGFLSRRNETETVLLEGREAYRYAWNTFTYRGFVWICFIRRSIVGQSLLIEAINGKEDGVFLLTLAPMIKRICVNDFNGYFYRATPGSLLKKKRSVEQCVSYIVAYNDLLECQKKLAVVYEVTDLLAKNSVTCVRNDIIEWASRPKDYARRDSFLVRNAYLSLLRKVGCVVLWYNTKRYFLGFALWRMTGSIFAISVTTRVFLAIRRCLNALKRKG